MSTNDCAGGTVCAPTSATASTCVAPSAGSSASGGQGCSVGAGNGTSGAWAIAALATLGSARRRRARRG
ncbi:MAG: MYXO-CTERM sorting domain-containing protein [Polyangiales bacterium]